MVRWHLVIPEGTDRTVRSFLARAGGKKGDLSKFVDQAVRERVFWETVSEVHEQNNGISSQDAQRLADEAVAWARENRP